jgi:hypothetical protein
MAAVLDNSATIRAGPRQTADEHNVELVSSRFSTSPIDRIRAQFHVFLEALDPAAMTTPPAR